MSPDLPNQRDRTERVSIENVGEDALSVWLATESAAGFDPQLLTPAELMRYRRIRSPLKRTEFEISRTLLYSLRLDTPIRSLSHSGGMVAVGACPCATALGIDIELHKPRDVVSLAQFAFDPAEAQAVAVHTKPSDLFYSLWVLKEASAKALGLELTRALRQCVFRIEDAIVAGNLPTRAPWRAFVWHARPDASLGAVVVGAPNIKINTIEWPSGSPAIWRRIVSLAGGDANAL
jgi:hypothetical protein